MRNCDHKFDRVKCLNFTKASSFDIVNIYTMPKKRILIAHSFEAAMDFFQEVFIDSASEKTC